MISRVQAHSYTDQRFKAQLAEETMGATNAPWFGDLLISGSKRNLITVR
jgi:hypothetical protein